MFVIINIYIYSVFFCYENISIYKFLIKNSHFLNKIVGIELPECAIC